MAEEKKEVNETFLASLFLVSQDNIINKKTTRASKSKGLRSDET